MLVETRLVAVTCQIYKKNCTKVCFALSLHKGRDIGHAAVEMRQRAALCSISTIVRVRASWQYASCSSSSHLSSAEVWTSHYTT